MGDPILRPANSALLFKIEATEGVDAAPVAADAFPFEADGVSYNSPYRNEQSNEATGSLVSGAPLVVGQPAEIMIRCRMKGANAAYTASVKPPHHALLQACGKKGLFTASVAAAALTAGSATSATLGTGFGSVAQGYRGMPLVLSGGPGAGRTTFVTDYTAAKVATLADSFSTPLSVATQAAIPANWTYAGTSPVDNAARLTDHPSGTLYIYEDGTLLKFVGCRGVISEWGGETAKPGFFTFKLMGIFVSRTDAAIPASIAIPANSAPILAQGATGVDAAFLVNRLPLPISSWSLAEQAAQESPDDPNTAYGFGAAQLGGRTPVLSVDPLATLVATRNTLADVAAFSQYTALIRAMGTANNRWALTMPVVQPVDAAPGTRGAFRSEDVKYQALTPGRDPQNRDGDSILCFW